ncbi:GLPGLI family protein [uncultured Chryseobacterium sp.]|uniref:GLPGLI family protein n=1 Tax=uncultured Chryseobacterium sp. TaxID=259322 RepID=UPI0025D77BD7|nr:GLPGLI family protein [uncultured Chryseobacterium sp.]
MKQITLFLILIFGFSYGQKTHRFIYELKFKKDSLAQKYDTDYYILDISEKEQKFYNQEFYQNDSISRLKINSEYNFSYPKLPIRLVHKDGSFYNYYSQTPLYYLLKTKDIQNWHITPDKKKLDKFTVQKATTQFGGRTWEAWFTTDIPFPYGPYKFYGLPGLILELSDTKENFIFSFKANKNINTFIDTTRYIETQIGLKPTEISKSQWKKLQLDYFINPLKDFGDGGLIVENERGEKVKANSRNIIENQQNYLRKYNNPIELDMAVQYPVQK